MEQEALVEEEFSVWTVEEEHAVGGGGVGEVSSGGADFIDFMNRSTEKKEDMVPSYDFMPIRPASASSSPKAARSNFDSDNDDPPLRTWNSMDAKTNSSPIRDVNLVFVAGATGKVGSRTVRELLKLGFQVRAGVRSIQRAESLTLSVRNLKLDDAASGTPPIDKLELVECDLEQLDRIKPALGNSSVVICCIGASEKEVLD